MFHYTSIYFYHSIYILYLYIYIFMIQNQCHVFFSTPKIFSFGIDSMSPGHPNLAIMFHQLHQQGLVESLTLIRIEMVGTQEPAIHNMFYHSELCKTLQNYLCCRNVHVSYYVITLYHHVYSFVISKWHKKLPYLGGSMIFPHLQ